MTLSSRTRTPVTVDLIAHHGSSNSSTGSSPSSTKDRPEKPPLKKLLSFLGISSLILIWTLGYLLWIVPALVLIYNFTIGDSSIKVCAACTLLLTTNILIGLDWIKYSTTSYSRLQQWLVMDLLDVRGWFAKFALRGKVADLPRGHLLFVKHPHGRF